MGEERGGLGGIVGGETIIRIHHVKKKNLFFNERKKRIVVKIGSFMICLA